MALEMRKSREYMGAGGACAPRNAPAGRGRLAQDERPGPSIECRALRPAAKPHPRPAGNAHPRPAGSAHQRPAARPRRGRRLLIAVALVAVGALLLPAAAAAGFITPKAGGSPNANQISALYKIVLYIAAVVFVIVEGALAYSLIRFRARKGRPAAQIHGNTRLEIGWTLAAALILVVLTVVTFVKLPSIINPPNSSATATFLSASVTEPSPPNGKKVTVCITGRQYIWRYTYGNDCNNHAFASKLPYSYQEMVVPAKTDVILVIQSTDVVHSWWVPSLGGKVDAVPGYTTYTWFNTPYAGSPGHPVIYHGQCAQLCGRQHAFMTALVKVVTPAQYQQWLSRQSQLISTANAQVGRLRQYLSANGNLPSGS
jgi:cytochrome c oxidase subunit 2